MKSQLFKLAVLATTTMLFISCNSSTSSSTVTITGSTANLATSSSSVDSGSFAATDGIDPTSVKLKIYQVAVSTSTDCSSPTTVFETAEADAEYVEFSADSPPTLGSGDIADGTYPCVIIEMSDQVKFTPAADSDNGFCDADTEETIDVCQDRGGDSPSVAELLDGTTTTCASGIADERVAIYLSTISATLPKDAGAEGGDEGNAFIAPTSSSTENGFFLDGAFTVSGASTASFVVDFTGRVAEEDGSECGMESPNWGFE